MDNDPAQTPQDEPKKPQSQPEPQPLDGPPQAVPISQAILAQILASQQAGLPYAGGPLMGTPQPRFAMPMQIPAAIMAQQTVQIWNGEYPPPDAVKAYESVLPGAFDRMMKMSEKNWEPKSKIQNAHKPIRIGIRVGHTVWDL